MGWWKEFPVEAVPARLRQQRCLSNGGLTESGAAAGPTRAAGASVGPSRTSACLFGGPSARTCEAG